MCRVDALTGVTLVCLQATDLLLLASVSPWQEGRIPRVRKVTFALATRAPLTVSHLMVSYLTVSVRHGLAPNDICAPALCPITD